MTCCCCEIPVSLCIAPWACAGMLALNTVIALVSSVISGIVGTAINAINLCGATSIFAPIQLAITLVSSVISGIANMTPCRTLVKPPEESYAVA